MTDSALLSELESSGALHEGHFRLSSGLHSNRYIQCARLLEHPARAERFGVALAAKLASFEPASVLSPALGGVIIGYEVASALRVPFRFSERAGGAMKLRRGFDFEKGERVAVIEDVVTTGGSAKEAADVARAHGASVVAFGAIIDRSMKAVGFSDPFVSLLDLEVQAFQPAKCPLCAAGVPLRAPGSRDLSV